MNWFYILMIAIGIHFAPAIMAYRIKVRKGYERSIFWDHLIGPLFGIFQLIEAILSSKPENLIEQEKNIESHKRENERKST